MTAKEYRDQYAKEQGYIDWVDLQYQSSYVKRRNHTDEVMKGYALSVLPEDRSDWPKPSPLGEIVDAINVGWNDCIDQIKKNIG